MYLNFAGEATLNLSTVILKSVNIYKNDFEEVLLNSQKFYIGIYLIKNYRTHNTLVTLAE